MVQVEEAPYIYARLGERYNHYYLDEFQDTSSLQWSNLLPLIGSALESESLSGEQGSLVLVGDPKQAIYRWRGGDIMQFIQLLKKKSMVAHHYRNLQRIPPSFALVSNLSVEDQYHWIRQQLVLLFSKN